MTEMTGRGWAKQEDDELHGMSFIRLGDESEFVAKRAKAQKTPQEEVTVAKERHELKLGKGSAFVKSRLKRLPQEDETWEADFRALPQAITQSATHYLGMVLTQPDGFLWPSPGRG